MHVGSYLYSNETTRVLIFYYYTITGARKRDFVRETVRRRRTFFRTRVHYIL